MNREHFTGCQVGTQHRNLSASLDPTPAIAFQFDQLFDLQLLDTSKHRETLDLTLVQTVLCYRTEFICLLFLTIFLTQSAVFAICCHFQRFYARRRRGSFVLKKKSGFYTVESGIFSTFQVKNSRHSNLSPDPDDDVSFFVFPSLYLPIKRYITLLLALCVLGELYLSIPSTLLSHDEQFMKTDLIFFSPFLSASTRLIALLFILHYLFRQTQPKEKVVFKGDSLSPSVNSRASQTLISIFWFVNFLNTALNIQQTSISFSVFQSYNTTLDISLLQICNACQWQTQLPSSSNSFAFTDDNSFYKNYIKTTFYLNWIYFCYFIVQFFLAFAPDFDVKLHSKHGSSSADNSQQKYEVNPEDKATFLSKFTFAWFSPTVYAGFKNPLTVDDIFPPSNHNQVRNLSKKFFFYHGKLKRQLKHLKKFVNLSRLKIALVLIRQYGLEYLEIAFLKLIPTLLIFLGPLLLSRLIRFVKNTEPHWHGFVYAAAMFLFPLIESLLNSFTDYRLNLLALKVRSTLISAIYERMLHCNVWSTASSRFSSATLINITSIDTERVLEFIKLVNLFWICPLQVIIAIFMLWTHLGYGSLAGLAVLLLLLPFNAYIGTKQQTLMAKLLKFKDQRVKTLNETVANIRSVKLYAWEEFFQERIDKCRQSEVANLKRQAYYMTAITFAFNSVPFLVAFASFAMYLLVNPSNRLDAQQMFVSLAIFAVIRKPLAFFPNVITSLLMVIVSLKRIGEFFDATERRASDNFIGAPFGHSLSPNKLQKSSPSIELKNCTFSWSPSFWEKSESNFLLNNITIEISEPKLVAIIGEIGAGKSSLLSAILGQMSRLSELSKMSHFEINGSLAYVTQEAFILSGTVKENILFHRKYDPVWYQRVIEACALTRDLQQFSEGDETIVSVKNLSGGQKQRISIARALYANSDVYLFDDPLSALDTASSKHIFNRVIGPNGLLAGKIRLLVTHNLAILPKVDHILLLKSGHIAAEGQMTELMREENEFTEFLARFLSEPTASAAAEIAEVEIVEPEDLQVLEEIATDLESRFQAFTRRGSSRRKFLCQRPSSEPTLLFFASISSPTIESSPEKPNWFPAGEDYQEDVVGRPMANDDSANMGQTDQSMVTKTGSVSCLVYLTYLRRVGFISSACILLAFFIANVFFLLSQLWLSTWSSDHDKSHSLLRPLYDLIAGAADLTPTQFSLSLLAVYGLWGLGQTVFILLGTLMLNIGALRASRLLHAEMLGRLMQTPLWFFADASSSSQLLNLFTKDIDIADRTLVANFLKLVIEFFRMLASFCPIILGTDPSILLFFIPLIFLYLAIYKFAIATSRQLIRVESALRTPIYSAVAETYSGVPVIQALGVERQFIRRHQKNIDRNAAAYLMSVTASRWLTIRLDLLGNLVVLSTAVFCVLKRGHIDSGMVGLCLTCAFTITNTLNMLIRSFTDLESNIVAVERLVEFTQLPQEAARHTVTAQHLETESTANTVGCFLSNCVPLCSAADLCKTAEEGLIEPSPVLGQRSSDQSVHSDASSWLQRGDIAIVQYSARYRDNLDLCLRDLNLSIPHGFKVAIVGRTGAGKSSFALSLFRLIEAESGTICISERNIQQLGLCELRTSLAIIPQDALLFSGSLRENMDPLGQYSDEHILSALSKVRLTDLLLRLSNSKVFGSEVLDQQLDESRLQAVSAGNRQLLCVARVLLRKSPKVLVLDEMAADMDLATEELVQEIISTEFPDCTVFSIAHRLDNVLRYPTDLVLVLDGGRVVECDSPKKLAADRGSHFYAMLQNRF